MLIPLWTYLMGLAIGYFVGMGSVGRRQVVMMHLLKKIDRVQQRLIEEGSNDGEGHKDGGV